jgi:hypothetical protein
MVAAGIILDITTKQNTDRGKYFKEVKGLKKNKATFWPTDQAEYDWLKWQNRLLKLGQLSQKHALTIRSFGFTPLGPWKTVEKRIF